MCPSDTDKPKIERFKRKRVKVDFIPRYERDKFDLNTYDVGDSYFYYGVKQNEVSPYTSYQKKKYSKRFVTTRGQVNKRHGITITRVK